MNAYETDKESRVRCVSPIHAISQIVHRTDHVSTHFIDLYIRQGERSWIDPTDRQGFRQGSVYEAVRGDRKYSLIKTPLNPTLAILCVESLRGVSEAQAVDAGGKIYTFGSYRYVPDCMLLDYNRAHRHILAAINTVLEFTVQTRISIRW